MLSMFLNLPVIIAWVSASGNGKQVSSNVTNC